MWSEHPNQLNRPQQCDFRFLIFLNLSFEEEYNFFGGAYIELMDRSSKKVGPVSQQLEAILCIWPNRFSIKLFCVEISLIVCV